MTKDKRNNISDESIAAYLEGNSTPEEAIQILQNLQRDSELQEILITAECIDNTIPFAKQQYDLLPMAELAATAKGNLCDLQCEEYLLKSFSITFKNSDLSEQARENSWLKDKGTPLHSVGRLLEQKGLSVTRRYNASLEDLFSALKGGYKIIVVVDSSMIVSDKEQIREEILYHALVVLEIDEANEHVIVFDPATQNSSDRYGLESFLYAWKEAASYLVLIKKRSEVTDYDPHPIEVNDVILTEELIELREAIAENAHDMWAAARIQEGWRYGPERNDNKKLHPDLKPYSDLPDSEKQYDRNMAMDTIKLVKKLGYNMVKSSEINLYRRFVDIMRSREDILTCDGCGTQIFKHQIYCDQCGRKL